MKQISSLIFIFLITTSNILTISLISKKKSSFSKKFLIQSQKSRAQTQTRANLSYKMLMYLYLEVYKKIIIHLNNSLRYEKFFQKHPESVTNESDFFYFTRGLKLSICINFKKFASLMYDYFEFLRYVQIVYFNILLEKNPDGKKISLNRKLLLNSLELNGKSSFFLSNIINSHEEVSCATSYTFFQEAGFDKIQMPPLGNPGPSSPQISNLTFSMAFLIQYLFETASYFKDESDPSKGSIEKGLKVDESIGTIKKMDSKSPDEIMNKLWKEDICLYFGEDWTKISGEPMKECGKYQVQLEKVKNFVEKCGTITEITSPCKDEDVLSSFKQALFGLVDEFKKLEKYDEVLDLKFYLEFMSVVADYFTVFMKGSRIIYLLYISITGGKYYLSYYESFVHQLKQQMFKISDYIAGYLYDIKDLKEGGLVVKRFLTGLAYKTVDGKLKRDYPKTKWLLEWRFWIISNFQSYFNKVIFNMLGPVVTRYFFVVQTNLFPGKNIPSLTLYLLNLSIKFIKFAFIAKLYIEQVLQKYYYFVYSKFDNSKLRSYNGLNGEFKGLNIFTINLKPNMINHYRYAICRFFYDVHRFIGYSENTNQMFENSELLLMNDKSAKVDNYKVPINIFDEIIDRCIRIPISCKNYFPTTILMNYFIDPNNAKEKRLVTLLEKKVSYNLIYGPISNVLFFDYTISPYDLEFLRFHNYSGSQNYNRSNERDPYIFCRGCSSYLLTFYHYEKFQNTDDLEKYSFPIMKKIIDRTEESERKTNAQGKYTYEGFYLLSYISTSAYITANSIVKKESKLSPILVTFIWIQKSLIDEDEKSDLFPLRKYDIYSRNWMTGKKAEGFFSPDNIAKSPNPPIGTNFSILNVFECSDSSKKFVYAQNNLKYTGFSPEILDKTLLYHKKSIHPTSENIVTLDDASKCDDSQFFQLKDYISYEKDLSNSFLVTNLSSSLPKCAKIGAYNISDWKEENLESDKSMLNELKNCVTDIRSYVAKKIICTICSFKDSPSDSNPVEFDSKPDSFLGFNSNSQATSNIPIFLVEFHFHRIKNDPFDSLIGMQKVINSFFEIYKPSLLNINSPFTYLTKRVPDFKDLQENFQFLNYEKDNYKVKYMIGDLFITRLTMLSQINQLPQSDKYISCVKALTFSGDKEDKTIQYPITYSEGNSEPEVFMNLLVPALGDNNFNFFFREYTDDPAQTVENTVVDPYFQQNFRETNTLCRGTSDGPKKENTGPGLKKYKLYGQKYFQLLATSNSYGSNTKVLDSSSNTPNGKTFPKEVQDFGLKDTSEPMVKSYFSPGLNALIYVQFKISKKHPAFFDDGLSFEGFDYLIENKYLPTFPFPGYYPDMPIHKIKMNSCIDASIAPAYLGSFFSTFCIRDSKNSIVYVSYRIFVRKEYRVGNHYKELCTSNIKMFAISERKSLTLKKSEEKLFWEIK